MFARVFVTAVLLILTLFAVGGHNRYEGPTLLKLSPSHGVHAGDVPLVLLAGLAILTVWLA